MQIRAIRTPEDEYADRLKALLAHKGGLWQWQIERALREPLDDLDVTYYVGQLQEELVANICTYARGKTAILGHVFTRPEHRLKGACKAIMTTVIEDYRRRGGKLIILGTGYDSPAYHIYRSFGFRSILPRSGFMQWEAEPGAVDEYFARADVSTAPLNWGEWAPVSQLYAMPQGDFLRSASRQIWGATNFEGGFLSLIRDLEEGTVKDAKVLRSRTGATVGVATVEPDRRFLGQVQLLDVFVHPEFSDALGELIDSVELPPGKVQCYVEGGAQAKLSALEARGFEREALLRGQVCNCGEPVDIVVFSRLVR